MKRTMFGKLMAVAVAGTLCVSMLAGCGNTDSTPNNTDAGNSNTSDTQGNTENQNTDSDSSDKVYHYTMAMYNSGPWNDPVESLAYYKEIFPDIDIELVYVEKANATEKISLLIGSKDTPDVMQMADRDTLYNQGALGSWTEEFFREHAPNISKIIDEIDPEAWNYVKYDGENMYSIPGWNLNNTYSEISVWNQDWLDAVGEKVPTTLEDAERVFYKFVKDDPDKNGANDTYAISEQGFKPIYGAFGFERGMWLDDGNGKLVFGDVMPQAKEALAKLSQWYKDGIIDPEFITGEAEGGYWALSQPLNKQKIGFTNAGWWYHWQPVLTDDPGDLGGRNYQEFKALNPDGTLAYGVPLVGPDGKSGHVVNNPLTFRTHFSKELCEDTERLGRLFEFIDYVNGSDMSGDMNPVITNYYGPEGQTWDYDENGLVKTHLTADMTWDDIGFSGWYGTFTFMEEGGSLNFQKTRRGAAPELDWIESITKDYPEGYTNKLHKTLETASEYKAELDKLLNEGYISIITGESPLDYFDEMVDLWYNNGGQEMTDEVNEWYSQYQ